MATTQKTASWGVSTSSPVTGVITDWNEAEAAVNAPELNEVGSTINQTMHDIHYTATATVQVAAGTDKPAAGTAVTVNDHTYYVVNAEIVESNSAYRKITLSLESFALCTAVEKADGIV